VNYGFDAQGRIASLSVDGVAVLTGVEYDPFGPARKWTWSNGEPMERVLDLDGRVKTLTLGPSTIAFPDLNESFTYDNVYRLLTATLGGGHSQSFTYDANGNRTSATIDAASTTYTYPSNSHRLSSLSGAMSRSFSYDAAGNTTAISGVTFTYDGRGRMKQAASVAYLVNGLGERVKKTGATETYFAYDEAGHLIGEYDAAGAPIEETLWLADTPVAVVKPDGSGGFAVFYIWSDHLNTPRMITDAANYDRWEWPNADPFGNNAPIEDPSGQGVFTYNLRFPGQYFDAETGLDYNYFRDYDPVIGRYLQSDPLGLAVGTNLFGYVDANPLGYYDPYGLFGWSDMPLFPSWAVNFSAGAGDDLSFGITQMVRRLAGVNALVDKCSTAYSRGTWAGVGLSMTFGAAHLGRAALNQMG
jgi:RHS repeat-associated protein